MDAITLSRLPKRFKLLATSLLCITGLVYIVLIVNIWIDTELRPSLISQAYGDMEYIELSYNAHIDLPHYAFLIFAVPVFLFMLSSFSERWKRSVAVFPFVLIVVDMGSMFLIPYLHKVIFSYVLWVAGTLLALTYCALFFLVLHEMWLKKEAGDAARTPKR